ncbi:MAG: hypothetical protein HYS32_02030 [Candidatus Woesearchaeota archaeon]|nr:MAG: hypothetical protein HYS32_02030 [Candidatus Woesearchaeota archaeon]
MFDWLRRTLTRQFWKDLTNPEMEIWKWGLGDIPEIKIIDRSQLYINPGIGAEYVSPERLKDYIIKKRDFLEEGDRRLIGWIISCLTLLIDYRNNRRVSDSEFLIHIRPYLEHIREKIGNLENKKDLILGDNFNYRELNALWTILAKAAKFVLETPARTRARGI